MTATVYDANAASLPDEYHAQYGQWGARVDGMHFAIDGTEQQLKVTTTTGKSWTKAHVAVAVDNYGTLFRPARARKAPAPAAPAAPAPAPAGPTPIAGQPIPAQPTNGQPAANGATAELWLILKDGNDVVGRYKLADVPPFAATRPLRHHSPHPHPPQPLRQRSRCRRCPPTKHPSNDANQQVWGPVPNHRLLAQRPAADCHLPGVHRP